MNVRNTIKSKTHFTRIPPDRTTAVDLSTSIDYKAIDVRKINPLARVLTLPCFGALWCNNISFNLVYTLNQRFISKKMKYDSSGIA